MIPLMEKSLKQGSKLLQICLPHYCNKMDEVTEDLDTALVDGSFMLCPKNLGKKKRWKQPSPVKCTLIPLTNIVPKSSALSEDSCSSFSLETKLHFQRDLSTTGSRHQSESDEVTSAQNYQLSSWRHCTANLGESDSVNENFRPCRTPRRKRKFKRMAIDPPSITDHDFQVLAQKNKRFRNIKSQKISVKCSKFSKLTASQLSAEMENICRSFATAACGKRKRCAHERSLECNSYECKEFIADKTTSDEASDNSNLCHHMDFDGSNHHDFSSTDLSTSESEYNEENREADDELSDFFQELGPTYGVPCIPAAILNRQCSNHSNIFGSSLKSPLSEIFQDKSERLIRSGRRRLETSILPVENENFTTPDLVTVPTVTDYHLPAVNDIYAVKVPPNDKKRRKQMSPLKNSLHSYDDVASVPESSIGFHMLQNMAWKPGTGLVSTSAGVVSPVKSSLGRNKEGLEFYL